MPYRNDHRITVMEVAVAAGSGGRPPAFPVPNGAEWPFPGRRVRRRRMSRFVSGRCRKIPRRAADSSNRTAAVGTGHQRAHGRQMLSPPSEGRPRRTIGRAPVGKARTIGDDPVAHAAARMPARRPMPSARRAAQRQRQAAFRASRSGASGSLDNAGAGRNTASVGFADASHVISDPMRACARGPEHPIPAMANMGHGRDRPVRQYARCG